MRAISMEWWGQKSHYSTEWGGMGGEKVSAVCGNYSFKNSIMMKMKKNLEDMGLKWIALFYFELRDRIECFVCWERVGL